MRMPRGRQSPSLPAPLGLSLKRSIEEAGACMLLLVERASFRAGQLPELLFQRAPESQGLTVVLISHEFLSRNTSRDLSFMATERYFQSVPVLRLALSLSF